MKVGEENITLTQEHLRAFVLLLSEFNRHFKDFNLSIVLIAG